MRIFMYSYSILFYDKKQEKERYFQGYVPATSFAHALETVTEAYVTDAADIEDISLSATLMTLIEVDDNDKVNIY